MPNVTIGKTEILHKTQGEEKIIPAKKSQHEIFASLTFLLLINITITRQSNIFDIIHPTGTESRD